MCGCFILIRIYQQWIFITPELRLLKITKVRLSISYPCVENRFHVTSNFLSSFCLHSLCELGRNPFIHLLRLQILTIRSVVSCLVRILQDETKDAAGILWYIQQSTDILSALMVCISRQKRLLILFDNINLCKLYDIQFEILFLFWPNGAFQDGLHCVCATRKSDIFWI